MPLVNCPHSVEPEVLQLLQSMMAVPAFARFSLAGGTSLALRLGHRTSVDIDLFTLEPFDSMLVQDQIAEDFPGSQVLNRTTGSLCVSVQGIKIDFLHHPFPLLAGVETDGAIRIMSLADVSAMKVNAVTNRGSKKGFIDLFALHANGLSLERSVDNFCTKYNGNKFLAIRSLLWLQDADQEPDPVFLQPWTWAAVRETMIQLADALE